MRLVFLLVVLFCSSISFADKPWDSAESPVAIFKAGMIAQGHKIDVIEGDALVIDENPFCELSISTLCDRQREATVLTLKNFKNMRVLITTGDEVNEGHIHVKHIDEDLKQKAKVAKRKISFEAEGEQFQCRECLIDAIDLDCEAECEEASLKIVVNPNLAFRLRRLDCKDLEILTPDLDFADRVRILY